MNITQTILKTYWQAAWNYKRYVIPLLFMVPFATIMLRLVPPIIAADVLNRLSSHNYTTGQAWDSFGQTLLLYGFVLFISGVVAWRVVIVLIWKLEGFVQRDLHRRMFKKFMELGSDFHSNNFGGSLVSQTNKLVSSYVRMQDVFAFQFYSFLVSFVFISIVLYPKAALFVWLMWGFAIIFIVSAIILSKPVRKLSAAEAASQNKITGQLADAVTNVMAIKSFSAKASEQKRHEEITEYSRHRTLDLMWSTTWRDTASSTITTILGIAALAASVVAVVNYNAPLGTVLLVVAFAGDLSQRLWDLSSSALRTYNRAIGDAQEGVITLNTEPTVRDPRDPKHLNVNKGSIAFNSMTFTHGEDDDALFRKFDLQIAPGTRVGLVGHSGSGKTTLTRLLLRYMDIDKGSIQIDGQDIAKTTQDDLRSFISYVPQEPMLFHRSLADNIGYGDPDANMDEIIRASKLAHAHEFISKLPEGYNTLVGERGVKLSGGQRQRVAIARAMLKNAPILVLDEATSALDSESEHLIQDALWKLMENKTAIVIAHRLSTVQKMDRIIVLDNGSIVEDGNHAQLLKKKGAYASLWQHQTGGFLEE